MIRKKKNADETSDIVDTTTDSQEIIAEDVIEEAVDAKSAPADRVEAGPYDESEANPVRPYIDLGGVKILPREGLNLRLEVEESTQRIIAVGLDYAGSTLQVQAFAAPRSAGLWHETREQITAGLKSQGGEVREVTTALGPELFATLPGQVTAENPGGARAARFVGVDGPRWFLRGVIAGAGAEAGNTEAIDAIDDLFRSVVVVRGGTPMPPRDLLALKMPVAPGTE
ncbi:DUF3710 domain-containing protein [Mycetocola tolaasinivorans]|uniref:DUF3710 domain-containing protein n=1 Tax=Mycetocola tolaasinivorans TaxID=76635 RepID=A0A3L7AA73_9MICO|nr:DUF3710 domain-containing protein [Mycetocola tolaasinivorans]RLP76965.1 DUF3710 domain-containing protein [Mycetocola tolaasinivorans]